MWILAVGETMGAHASDPCLWWPANCVGCKYRPTPRVILTNFASPDPNLPSLPPAPLTEPFPRSLPAALLIFLTPSPKIVSCLNFKI